MKDTPNHKFLGIQALRMIAAFLVLYTHATYYTFERLDKGFVVWDRGTRGVDIFFVISGFVMIFASRRLFGTLGGWRHFLELRVVRIVPLYWLLTTLKVVTLLLTAGLALHAKLGLVTVVCSYLFLPARNIDGNIAPLVNVGWTLNFEMLFYFLFSTALFFRVNVYRFIGVSLAALSIGAYFRQPFWPAPAFYLNSMVLEFWFGMLIAKACIHGIYCPKKASPWLLALGFALLLLPPAHWNLPKVLINGLPAGVIVWSAASLGSMERLIPRVLLYLGDASYAIYLIHPFVAPLPAAILNRIHMNLPWLSVTLAIAFGLGFGCALHEFVELPVTGWLRGLLKLRRGLAEEIAPCPRASSAPA